VGGGCVSGGGCVVCGWLCVGWVVGGVGGSAGFGRVVLFAVVGGWCGWCVWSGRFGGVVGVCGMLVVGWWCLWGVWGVGCVGAWFVG